MTGSASYQEKNNKLPAIVPESETSPATTGKRSGIIGALAVFAPLAIEVIYGLTRKWLAGTTADKNTGRLSGKPGPMNNLHVTSGRSFFGGRFQRRYRRSRG